jgi:hypothetical protein
LVSDPAWGFEKVSYRQTEGKKQYALHIVAFARALEYIHLQTFSKPHAL